MKRFLHFLQNPIYLGAREALYIGTQSWAERTMTNLNIIPENRSIGDLKHASEILECMEFTHNHRSNNDVVLKAGEQRPSKKFRCDFFRGMDFHALEQLVKETPCESGKCPEGLPYRIYEIPESYHRIIDAILGVQTPCDKYCRLYIQIEDGIVAYDFGEYFKDRSPQVT